MKTTKLVKSPWFIQLIKQCLLIALFSSLLSTAFLNNEHYYFAWFAFVPLLFAIDNKSLAKTYFIGLTAGLTLFFSGTYWILDFITIAKQNNQNSNIGLAFIYWFYCAHQIILMLLLFNWLRKKTPLHDFILFPLIIATLTFAYPMLFSMRLGESQVHFFSALQATEFLGVHSLDAIIALANIMLFHFIRDYIKPIFIDNENINNNNKSMPIKIKVAWSLSISLIGIWFVYGVFSLQSWNKKINQWQTIKVGIVQPNEVPAIGKQPLFPGYSLTYPPELEMTKRLASQGAEITVWPESQSKHYLNNSQIRNSFKQSIKQLNTNLIFQDLKSILNSKNGQVMTRFNSAIMLNSEGEQVGIYNKIKRIPFGEYVPVFKEGTWINLWMEDFLGDFLNKYSQGERHQSFQHKQINFIPLICYETTFPEFVGSAVQSATQSSTRKNKINNQPTNADLNANILVGLSNDGWFGSTHQPYQHIVASVLRAVENRLPLIHVANNGPSIVVTPQGKIIFTSDFQQAAGYLVDVPYSNQTQGSFYSRHPNLLTTVFSLLLSLLIIYALAKPLLQRQFKKRD